MSLSSLDLAGETGDMLDDDKLAESAVLLVPPNIPLTCFPSIIEKLLSILMTREWQKLSERAKNYLKWFSVKAESVDVLTAHDVYPLTKGFEMLSIDREGRSFGGILQQCQALRISSVLVRFASLIAALVTLRLLKQQTDLSHENLGTLRFTQNVDADYLNYPMALKLLLQLFPEYKRLFYLELSEHVTKDYLKTIRTLAQDLEIGFVLDDSNKMDAEVHLELLDLTNWIKIDYQATLLLERYLAADKGAEIVAHFEKYATGSGSRVIVLEGLSEESPLKTFLQERWKHSETSLYYQSRERLPVAPWNRYFGMIQDYLPGEFGLFFKGMITTEK